MKLYKILLVVPIVTVLLNAEQSVYSDSDFIDTDKVVKQNSREIFILKQKIGQLKEQIEGLKSIIKSQTNQISTLKQKTNNNLVDIVNKLSQRVATLESKPATVVTKVVKETAPREEIDGTLGDKPAKVKEPKTKIKDALAEDIPSKKLSKEEMYKQAVIDFSNKRYTKAKSVFSKLLSKGYKKDSSSFYLGEIAYRRGQYKSAIVDYQKSATINENASYMDKLLLHTAISLKKIGKSSEAKSFFQAIVDSYPNSSSAREAKKYLK